ncbi:MAG: ParA family protein [Calditrichaceae bacterium]|jgi:chromosome partitioning protein
MKFIVVINNKGGVGKTTSVVNLAASFARLGKKTLLVDLDPSASASIHLGFDKSAGTHKTLCDYLLAENRQLKDYIYPTSENNLHCLPSETALSEFYDEILMEENVKIFMDRRDFPKNNEIVIFDTPPNMGSLAMNALAIADYALIPIQTQHMALTGLDLTIKLVEKAQRHLNPKLEILGYFGTNYDRRTNVAKEVYASIQSRFGKKVFNTVIGINSKLIEAYSAQKPILAYAPSARGAKEYKNLAAEIIKRLN